MCGYLSCGIVLLIGNYYKIQEVGSCHQQSPENVLLATAAYGILENIPNERLPKERLSPGKMSKSPPGGFQLYGLKYYMQERVEL